MPSYAEVNANYQEIRINKYYEMDTKVDVVGVPLRFLGEVFKNLFVYTLGFEWFFDLTDDFDLPVKRIMLPTFTYTISSLGRHLVSSFKMSSNPYDVTLLNFLFVPFNYVSRNLGKLIGYTLASLFTVPAYLIIKATYKIKEILLHKAYQKSLDQMDNSSLVENWITSLTLPIGDIAKRITIDTLWNSHTNREAGVPSCLTHEIIKNYAHERNFFLESIKPWPITAASRKIRVQIETEQGLLASVISSRDLGSIWKLMNEYETVQNIATVLAASTGAHEEDFELNNSMDPLLLTILEFAGVPPLSDSDVTKAQKLSATLEVDAQMLALSMMSQGGPLSNQGFNSKPEDLESKSDARAVL